MGGCGLCLCVCEGDKIIVLERGGCGLDACLCVCGDVCVCDRGVYVFVMGVCGLCDGGVWAV